MKALFKGSLFDDKKRLESVQPEREGGGEEEREVNSSPGEDCTRKETWWLGNFLREFA